MKLFCLAPSIWPTLHYEADLILQESASESGDITIVSCNKFRSDCPANKLRSRLVCSVCRLRNNDLKSYLARTITKRSMFVVWAAGDGQPTARDPPGDGRQVHRLWVGQPVKKSPFLRYLTLKL